MKQITYALTCLLLCINITGNAQLDPSFSGDGKVTTGLTLPPPGASNRAESVAIQADGKIVVAGGESYHFSVARYYTTGLLDNTFNLDGKVVTEFGNSFNTAKAVAIQPDGRIVVAGFTHDGANNNFAIARYNTNGTPDISFSSDGKVTTDFGREEQCTSVVIQPDGKIVVAGVTYNNPSPGLPIFADFAVARYNSNGALDNSFSGDGKLTTGFTLSGDDRFDRANSVAIQADGKIVVAGSSSGDGTVGAIARYKTDGTPDNSFSGDGMLTTSDGYGAYSVAIQAADQKIVVAGSLVSRYNTTGTLDNSFSGDGVLALPFTDRYHSSIAIQANGKIVAAGSSFTGSTYDFAVIRYNTDGVPDNSFSGDGMFTSTVGSFNDFARAVAIQVHGKIVVAGGADDNAGNSKFALIRRTSSGNIDKSFTAARTDIGNKDEATTDKGRFVAVKPDGKIVVVGMSLVFTNTRIAPAIIQYDSKGSLDPNFGFQGAVLGEFPGGNFTATTAAIQKDGKIIVGGYFEHGKTDFALARYNTDGSLDNSFNHDGFVTTAISPNAADYCYAIAVQPDDGKIIAAGASTICNTGCPTNFAIVRYNANGTPDNTFGTSGIVTTDFFSRSDYIRSIALRDGKIVVAGYTDNGSNTDFALARYLPNGNLDYSFSVDGKLTTNVTGNSDYARSVRIQDDGKIVAGGYSYNGSNYDFSLVRYNPDGTLDNSFSGDGKQTTGFNSTSQDYCTDIIIERGASGKIIAGGYSNAAGNYDFALVRFLSNGTTDNSFSSNNGKVTINFSNSSDYGAALDIGTDGKLVMAGDANYDYAVARYLLTPSVTLPPNTNLTQASKSGKVIGTPGVEVFPNPVSTKAVVTYTLDKDAAISIDLLDITGKKVKTLENGRSLLKGSYQTELNREGLPPGIYVLRITKDSVVMTKKLVID